MFIWKFLENHREVLVTQREIWNQLIIFIPPKNDMEVVKNRSNDGGFIIRIKYQWLSFMCQENIWEHGFLSICKCIDNEVHDQMGWCKFKRISRRINDWKSQCPTLLPLMPWCYLRPSEKQILDGGKLKGKNSKLTEKH